MTKKVRQNKIIEIISTTEIDTQEELAQILNASGFNVTQATVSRDVKELGLIKINGSKCKHRYSITSYHNETTHDDKFLHLFRNCVVDIIRAQNLVVVKTLGGNGNSAGVLVDKLNIKEIVGSVAGDDTLLIVTHSEKDAEVVLESLKKLISYKNYRND
ncbi:MAG: arginine repressor [Clostridia bacterium]|nr:arginine repressor [Clostridiales bacterium]MDD7165467.1 arginine repressor [Clostridia bacterium]MDY2900912.1 arginine repressor [Christensenellaceae bacterium]